MIQHRNLQLGVPHLPKSSSDLCGLLSRSRLEPSRRSRSLSQSLSLSRLSCSLTALLLTDTGQSKVGACELSANQQNSATKVLIFRNIKKRKNKKKLSNENKSLLKMCQQDGSVKFPCCEMRHMISVCLVVVVFVSHYMIIK